MDAIFMPVQKVDFKIENVYDNSDEVTERLILDIWTNGSITPEEAISEASEFIVDFFRSIIENKTDSEITESPNETLVTPLDPHTNIAIEELQLSVRAYNCLKRAQILTLADLANESYTSLLALRNFGQKSAEEVTKALATYGIELAHEAES
jgi:DNA-directed RNA polymerase subunit alpha